MSIAQSIEHRRIATKSGAAPYIAEAKYAFLRFIRTPAFAIPTLAFPVFFYLLVGFIFGAFKAKNASVDLPLYLFCGFSTMTAIAPGIFGFGIGFANEREQGLLTLKRALPMPPFAALLGSVVMSMLATVIASALLATFAAALGAVDLTLSKVAAIIGIVTLGAIPFCALGLLLGSLTSARAAPAIANIFYILILYFSGLFVALPKSVAWVAHASPAFYLHQLTLTAVGTQSKLIGGVFGHIGVLLVITLVALILATRRLARVG